ncbi:unnamed protein product [Paramecium octaurelia]|uniref:Uncharacterized protein n=1 Tax=Paramecium octaurelia TaxID=43137 RepID=A0A8S1W192_PAROT|nr:unnamed protein product [Paramecium octaurelia]
MYILLLADHNLFKLQEIRLIHNNLFLNCNRISHIHIHIVYLNWTFFVSNTIFYLHSWMDLEMEQDCCHDYPICTLCNRMKNLCNYPYHQCIRNSLLKNSSQQNKIMICLKILKLCYMMNIHFVQYSIYFRNRHNSKPSSHNLLDY